MTSPAVPSHREIVKKLSVYAKSDTRKGLTLFAIEFCVFWTAMAGVLFAPSLGWKIAASVLAGLKLSSLATMAHDAAHNSLTASRRLNFFVATLAFMHCFYNYRLWIVDHHGMHHARTNGEDLDSFQPLSKADYDALSPAGRLWVRFYRSGPLAFGVYYIWERYFRFRIMPRHFTPAAQRASAWKHFAFVMAYVCVLTVVLVSAPHFAPISASTAVILGMIVPFFIFQTLQASALYINHTHPEIPWFATEAERRETAEPEYMSLHLRFPKALSRMFHNFFDHAAHHVYPAIPCYRLREAQLELNRLVGDRAVVEDFTFRGMADILRKCKLYDYENHCWLDYDGVPTTCTPRSILRQRGLTQSYVVSVSGDLALAA